MAAPTDRGVPLSTLCPKFLHTNSTSHTWPFSAIAELIDNAYDPDVSAKQFWIDKTLVRTEDCLTFMDNGNGLDYETMHKMLSFGYSDKIAVNGLEPIGIYGNGFKSGSMRLGKDAIVFSKSKTAQCVGMLSQTYLEEINATQIIVPIVCFEQTDGKKIHVRDEHKASLQDILRYSPFKTEAALLTEVNIIGSSWSNGSTGTRIIIWNLRRTEDQLEFDFQRDRYDMRIPSDIYMALNDGSQNPERISSYIPETTYSLRAYCSILYLKPRMQIVIRGVKVKSQLVAKNLAFIRKDHYKPNFLNKRIPITFGYNTKSKDQYGIMMYHKNRLIKAYERIGCQLKANNRGVGVIGVIECNFLDPTHNKQSFLETDKYRKTMTNLGIKLEEYWNEIRYRRSTEHPNSIPVEDVIKRPDQNWVQCDDCLQWRKLPDGIDCSKLPDKWFCHFNPDPQFRSCQVEQEPEDSDDDSPSYSKTYKKQEKEDKRNAERIRVLASQKHLAEQRFANLAKAQEELRWQQQGVTRQLHQNIVPSPSTPTTPRSRFNRDSVQGGAARAESSALSSSTISQAACSPSSNNGLPIISNVCSLKVDTQRAGKRPQPVTPQSSLKRSRLSLLSRDVSNVDVSPVSTASVPVDSDDDDVIFVDSGSIVKPKNTEFSLSKVKQEPTEKDSAVNLLLECSDDAAVDPPPETNEAGTSSSMVSSSTTQTEVRGKIKEEKDDRAKDKQNLDSNQTNSGEKVTAGTSSDVDVKEENHRGSQSEKQTLQNGLPHHLDNDKDVEHSSADASLSLLDHPTMSEIQQQQDQLLELMQTTAQERDSLKEELNKLKTQLQETERRLKELSEINVKKECSHQHTQTEGTQDEKDYKSLFEKAKQKVKDLIKEKVDLLAAAEAKPGTVQGEEKDIDEISLQVSRLLQELEQRNKERSELESKLDSLEDEKANLASKCEELNLRLQQQRENTGEGSRAQHQANDSSLQADPEEAGGSANSGSASTSDACRSLIELRHNVARLLVLHMPALELDQVNYDCNVIDEILEQYLNSREEVAV